MSARQAWFYKQTRTLRNRVLALRRLSAFMLGFIVIFAVGFQFGLYTLFRNAFAFIDRLFGVGSLLVSRLFVLFVLAIGLMQIISSGVTAYATYFRGRDIPFLVAHPLSVSQIVRAKFRETAVLSAWSFFFIIVPYGAAYARYEGLSPMFAVWLFVFSIPFLALTSGLGILAMLLIARWFPRNRLVRIAFITLVLGSLLAALILVRARVVQQAEGVFAMTNLVPGLRMASNPLVPGWWMAEGVLSMLRARPLRGMMLWGVLASAAYFLYCLCEAIAIRTFFASWQRSLVAGRAHNAQPLMLRRVESGLRRLRADTRALIMKDIRTFLRDPMQWTQSLVFFGLLAVYFFNLRTFRYHVLPDYSRSMIAVLNVFSVSAVLCSLGARFVYPQLSLEGQSFWILGLAPTSMRRVLLTKFGLSVAAMLAVSVGLITVSTIMLDVPSVVSAIASAVAVSVSLAVSGLSIGLGAFFIDIRQSNPAAIVSGFGGTLNLVSAMVFMIAVIAPYAAVLHARQMGAFAAGGFRVGLLAASAWVALLTLTATALPLILGCRRLKRYEFE